MNSHLCKFLIPLSAVATGLYLPVAVAQGQESDAWQFEATPYLWAAGLDGSVQVGPLSAESSQSVSDLLKTVDFGFTGLLEARKGRWGILFDGMYIKTSNTADTPIGGVRVKVTQQMYSLGAAWRAVEGPAAVDLIGGLRYNYIKPEIRTPALQRGDSKDALDPFIGIRGLLPVSERWALFGYTDVGTFAGSDWAWQLAVGANYAINEKMTFKTGYRRYKTDFSKSNIDIDTTMHGLYFGLGYRF